MEFHAVSTLIFMDIYWIGLDKAAVLYVFILK